MSVLDQMAGLFADGNPLSDKKDPQEQFRLQLRLLATLSKIKHSDKSIESFEDFKKVTESLGEDGKELFDFIVTKIRKMSPPETVITGFEKEQDVIDVLKKLEAKGYAWKKGEKPTEWTDWMKDFAKYQNGGGFILTIPKFITFGENDEEQKDTSNPDNEILDFKKFLNQD